MRRKISITVIIFFSAFMLNVSAMAFQQRCDRREDDNDFDPFVIEMTDMHVLKYLKNTWYYDLPLEKSKTSYQKNFFNDDSGFGNTYTFTSKAFTTCQLKFVLMEYIGFYETDIKSRTYYWLSSV